MKTFEITLKRDDGAVSILARAQDIKAAKAIVLTAEGAPESAIKHWRVVPTGKQIKRTQNLLRSI